MNKKIKKDLIIIMLLTVLIFLPFINKAYHIDDTLFLRSAEQILKNPLRPYDFDINWYYVSQPMRHVTKNPPLNAYILAFLGKIGGFGERYIHSVFILFALGSAVFIYSLSRKLSKNAIFFTLLVVLSPCFWVMGTNIMGDMPLLFFMTGAIVLYVYGEEKNNRILLVLAMLFAGLAALTKYVGIGITPLLFIYQLARRKNYKNFIYFVIPTAIFGLWTYHNYHYYGFSHFALTCLYKKPVYTEELMNQLSVTLIFMSACLVSPIIFAFKKDIINILAASLAAMFFLYAYPALILYGKSLSFLQCTFIVFLFWASFYIILKSVSRPGEAKGALWLVIYLWFYGILLFNALFNWSVSGRNILIMAPPAILLCAEAKGRFKNFFIIVIIFIVSLATVLTDYFYADVYRDFSEKVGKIVDKGKKIYFAGHWGFQYYMENEGYVLLRHSMDLPKEGFYFVVPRNVSNRPLMDKKYMRRLLVDRLVYENPFDIALRNRRKKACFYSSTLGIFPYVYTKDPLEEFLIYEYPPSALR